VFIPTVMSLSERCILRDIQTSRHQTPDTSHELISFRGSLSLGRAASDYMLPQKLIIFSLRKLSFNLYVGSTPYRIRFLFLNVHPLPRSICYVITSPNRRFSCFHASKRTAEPGITERYKKNHQLFKST